MKRTQWEARFDKHRAMEAADAAGLVADGMDYRIKLMNRVQDGEITLEQAQAELKKVKRDAKKSGLITRNQAYIRG